MGVGVGVEERGLVGHVEKPAAALKALSTLPRLGRMTGGKTGGRGVGRFVARHATRCGAMRHGGGSGSPSPPVRHRQAALSWSVGVGGHF